MIMKLSSLAFWRTITTESRSGPKRVQSQIVESGTQDSAYIARSHSKPSSMANASDTRDAFTTRRKR